jgi:hypothetical protein
MNRYEFVILEAEPGQIHSKKVVVVLAVYSIYIDEYVTNMLTSDTYMPLTRKRKAPQKDKKEVHDVKDERVKKDKENTSKNLAIEL